MFATRRFGRDLSNVTGNNNTLAGKPLATKKTETQTKGLAYTNAPVQQKTQPVKTSQVSVFANQNTKPQQTYREPPKPQYEEESEPMSIDLDLDLSLEDIDQYDTCDPQFVSEYIKEIMEFLKEKELAVRIPADYCRTMQKEIIPSHRDQIVRWVGDIYVELKLLTETYFLAVNIIDQVLATGPLKLQNIQLVAITAVLIASKYEETWATPIDDLIIVSSDKFTRTQILKTERVILNRINFNLCSPAPIHFLRRYSKAGHSDGTTHTIAKYLAEITCLHYDLLQYLPSQIAAACVFLSRYVKRVEPYWNSNLSFYSGYSSDDILPCVRHVVQCIKRENPKRNNKVSSITKKYAEKRFLHVSQLVAQVFE